MKNAQKGRDLESTKKVKSYSFLGGCPDWYRFIFFKQIKNKEQLNDQETLEWSFEITSI